ncbi:MAG TPA: formate--tetrahydrofolate ligase [Chloroflexota bacterium]|jgi:formate--tetrahydrofolate ligase|nr:formate--tetrahydrofolate ligase [Chloroflexota bacterium]
MPFPSDLEIAQAATLKPITEIGANLGLLPDEIEQYGKYKAKVELTVRDRLRDRPQGKYVVVTAITPTPLGEGKTTTTVGLGQGLNYIGKKAVITIRQPSLGPVFGIKGGAAGGGYSQVIPMEDFNLHLTGDFHAVTAAHNLMAAVIDNSLFHGNPLNIDMPSITWKRVLDVNDRALRNIIVGLGGREDGVPRQSGFDITTASEIMAIFALTTGLEDLQERLGRIIFGRSKDGKPLTAKDLGVDGAMAVLMKDTLKPNLLQTLENGPAFVHAGPFGNIAHGNSSIIADEVALRTADFCVTEAGFGADLGFEKFVNIKCRTSGLKPNAAVVVATVRALKSHSGKFRVVAGRPLDPRMTEDDPQSVEEGIGNLTKQIENVAACGLPAVVAINRFPTDSPGEIEVIKRVSKEVGAYAVCETFHHAEGGKGAAELAEAVVGAAEAPNNFHFLYELPWPLKDKIEAIAKTMYGAAGVDYLPAANAAIKRITDAGYNDLAVCMAKTHLSLSDNPNLKGRPSGFNVTVRDVNLSAGAGFVYPLLGDMRTMPGLPTHPASENVHLTSDGKVVGLF